MSDRSGGSFSKFLDIGQVVVAGAHPLSQFGISATCLLGGGNGGALAPSEFPVEADDRRERVIVHPAGGLDPRKSECRVRCALLHPFEFDLKSRPRIRCASVEKFGDLCVQRCRDARQQREPGFFVAVLDQGELAAGNADVYTELI